MPETDRTGLDPPLVHRRRPQHRDALVVAGWCRRPEQRADPPRLREPPERDEQRAARPDRQQKRHHPSLPVGRRLRRRRCGEGRRRDQRHRAAHEVERLLQLRRRRRSDAGNRERAAGGGKQRERHQELERRHHPGRKAQAWLVGLEPGRADQPHQQAHQRGLPEVVEQQRDVPVHRRLRSFRAFWLSSRMRSASWMSLSVSLPVRARCAITGWIWPSSIATSSSITRPCP